jgi:hypothetical protein
MINPLLLPVNVFAKSATCPSADKLLAYSKSLLPAAQNRFIAAHLDECDFCQAELQLLERFPTRSEAVVVAEMPASLRALAVSILCKPPASQPHPSLESRRTLNH